MKSLAMLTVIAITFSSLAQSQEIVVDEAGVTGIELRTHEASPRPLRINPSFDPAHNAYQLSVANRFSELTILANTSSPQWTLRYSHRDGSLVTDADPEQDGFQVSIDKGTNLFRLEATGPGDDIHKNYRITVVRNAFEGETTTLVSNIAQPGVRDEFSPDRYIAQYFTTPHEGVGYEIRSIKIRTSMHNAGHFDLALHRVDSDNDVAEKLFDFQRPQRFGGREQTFSAPPDAVLEPGATYAARIRRLPSTVLWLQATRGNSESSKGIPGWKIADTHHVKHGARWLRSRTNASLRLAVEGTRFIKQSTPEQRGESALPDTTPSLAKLNSVAAARTQGGS